MGNTSFLDAVENGELEKVKEMLASGTDANTTDEHQRSAAYKAAKKGHLEILKVLVEHGADIDMIDNRGTNALYWAALNSHTDVAAFLLEQGAQTDIKDDRGWTIYDHIDSAGDKKMHGLLESYMTAANP